MTGRRMFVICSHPLFLKSLRVLLDHPEIEWVGLATDFVDLPAQIESSTARCHLDLREK